jgi:hypothetical protein
MRPLALLFTVFSLPCLHGQTTFNRLYGLPFPNEELAGGGSIERYGVNYTILRLDRYNDQPASFLIFQATNSAGDLLFTTSLADSVHPFAPTSFVNSRTTSDFFGCGLKQNQEVLPYTTSFIVRYNDQGDTLWYHEYTNSDPYYSFLTNWAMVVGPNDELTISGFTIHDAQAPYNTGPQRIHLMRTSPLGIKLWEHTYADHQHNEAPAALAPTPDGGFMIGGYYQVFTQNFQVDHAVAWLLKTDSLGNELWYRELDGNVGIQFIHPLQDGNYLVGGSSSDTCCGFRIAGFVAKMDTAANLMWRKDYYRADSLDGFWDGLELSDGSLLLCGEVNQTPGVFDQAGWLMKTDGEGNILWDRVIDKTGGYDTFSRITATSDGGILLTGQAHSDQLSDVWLVKIDSLGCDSAGCPLDIHTGITPVVTSSEVETHAMLTAVPNPFTNTTLITFPPLEAGGELVVRDALGRVVLRKRPSAGSTSVEITLRSEPPGLYIASLACTGHQTRSVRLMHEP